MAPASFEVSSTYAGGLVKALRELSLLTPQLEDRLDPLAKAFVTEPYGRGWWPGEASTTLLRLVLEAHGAARLEEAGLRTIKNSMGPIITPLTSVVGAIFGLKPSTLLERMGEFSTTSVRGVSLAWTLVSPTHGRLHVTYPPGEEGKVFEPMWRGACLYAFDVTKTTGGTVSSQVDGSSIVFDVRW
ncbi:MAG: hypothetical protein GQE15_11170 [Archangiaceae bacterium]|nr:hypothetical protein [Archangiaceae bacterium]